MNIYIELWDFKVKCTQYAICAQATFKNARAMFFEIGQDMQHVLVGIKKNLNFGGVVPRVLDRRP